MPFNFVVLRINLINNFPISSCVFNKLKSQYMNEQFTLDVEQFKYVIFCILVLVSEFSMLCNTCTTRFIINVSLFMSLLCNSRVAFRIVSLLSFIKYVFQSVTSASSSSSFCRTSIRSIPFNVQSRYCPDIYI